MLIQPENKINVKSSNLCNERLLVQVDICMPVNLNLQYPFIRSFLDLKWRLMLNNVITNK